MGDLWRSEEMQLVQLFIPVEAARETVDKLGEVGMLQFRDKNANVNLFQRHFVNEVKRADEMDRKVRFFSDQIKKVFGKIETAALNLNTERDEEEEESGIDSSNMDELDAHFDDLEKELVQMNANKALLDSNHNDLTDLRHVLMKDNEFFATAGQDSDVVDNQGEEEDKPLLDEESSTRGDQVYPKTVRLGFLTGVIERHQAHVFERVLWRATRGNLYMKMASIDDGRHSVRKNVFIVFYQGQRAQAKIKKICDSLGARLYPCPDSPAEREKLLAQVDERLDDLNNVLQRSKEHRRRVLEKIADNLDQWKEKVFREKSIYHTMNMFDYQEGHNMLIAEGWCPTAAEQSIKDALEKADKASGASVKSIFTILPTAETPPTYFKTNKFTSAFQSIVDAYGVCRYGEINPTPFTIITFPFLFAIMFGDVGHGAILLMISLWMIYNEKWLVKYTQDEMFSMIFGGRYMLALMSAFSIYTGFLYNEVFSVPMDLFGSKWAYPEVGDQMIWTFPKTAYWAGVDPAWKYKKNELNYFNSLKMKISVVFGVTHMSVGILLSLLNGIKFRKMYNIFFEFVPQIIFMQSIFGYMCFLIFLKWSTDYAGTDTVSDAPNLLNMMIYMFLKPTSKIDGQLYGPQHYVQYALIVFALVSVPFMLFFKPFLLRNDHKNAVKLAEQHNRHHNRFESEEDVEHGGHHGGTHEQGTSQHHDQPASGGGEHGEGEEFDFSEIFVHQVIHTIEFVLGCVSNTASYLRLWALSLAHAELSYVFWDNILVAMLIKNNAFFIFCGFAVWAVITVMVLLIMESLSAFLHALRLHWVEFQNKFFQGDGYAFEPFSYKIMKEAQAQYEREAEAAAESAAANESGN